MILTYFKLGLYQIIIRYISGITVKNVLYAVIISSVSIYVLSYLFSLNIPRSIPIIFSFFILISTLGIRFVVKQFYIIYQNQNHEPIAIYGAGKTGRSLVNIFRENREFSPKFFLDDDLSLHKKEINGLIVIISHPNRNDVVSIKTTKPTVSVVIRSTGFPRHIHTAKISA